MDCLGLKWQLFIKVKVIEDKQAINIKIGLRTKITSFITKGLIKIRQKAYYIK